LEVALRVALEVALVLTTSSVSTSVIHLTFAVSTIAAVRMVAGVVAVATVRLVAAVIAVATARLVIAVIAVATARLVAAIVAVVTTRMIAAVVAIATAELVAAIAAKATARLVAAIVSKATAKMIAAVVAMINTRLGETGVSVPSRYLVDEIGSVMRQPSHIQRHVRRRRICAWHGGQKATSEGSRLEGHHRELERERGHRRGCTERRRWRQREILAEVLRRYGIMRIAGACRRAAVRATGRTPLLARARRVPVERREAGLIALQVVERAAAIVRAATVP
jgi:hypothetical protein